MKSINLRVAGILLMGLLLVAGTACSKKNVPAQPGLGAGTGYDASSGGMAGAGGGGGMDDASKWRELGITSEAEKREFLEKARAFENQDIFFDFNGYALSEPAKKILDEKIAFMKRYAKVKTVVEGHCDERGTTEYNLALGERRANSAMQYMVNTGVSAQNISTISYGKERPLSPAHDEAAWAKNRRDHFNLKY